VITRDHPVRAGYPLPDFAAAWAKHRKLSRIAIWMFVLWIPYGCLVFALAGGCEQAMRLWFAPMVVYRLAWIAIGNRAWTWFPLSSVRQPVHGIWTLGFRSQQLCTQVPELWIQEVAVHQRLGLVVLREEIL
jgi:hypothetical protein